MRVRRLWRYVIPPSLLYCVEELTRRKGLNYHGASSDIWSCGIILFALLTGRLPFDDENIRTLLAKVKAGRFTMPAELPADAQDLIKKMLEVDPKQRITVRFSLLPLLVLYGTEGGVDGKDSTAPMDDSTSSESDPWCSSLFAPFDRSD